MIIKSILVTLIVSVVLALVIFMCSFLPHKKELMDGVKISEMELGKDVEQLYVLAVSSETVQGLSMLVSRRAYEHLSKNDKTSKILTHFNTLLWHVGINLFFNEKDIFFLWSHYAIFYDGQWGINNMAVKVFDEPINQLSLHQQAVIISMVKSPEIFKPGSKRSETRVKWLLEKMPAKG